jgi:hypothetical protein
MIDLNITLRFLKPSFFLCLKFEIQDHQGFAMLIIFFSAKLTQILLLMTLIAELSAESLCLQSFLKNKCLTYIKRRIARI